MPPSDIQKAKREREIFRIFLKSVGCPHDDALIESRSPPEPDICYRGRTEIVAFELVEICDSDLTKAIAVKLKQGGGVVSMFTSDPTPDLINQKLRKQYETSHPVELLCYNAGRTISPDDLVCYEIKSEIDQANEVCFRRIWYCGDKTHCVHNPLGLSSLS